jgi:Protein of unknown function (Gmx_para_CXXCG)
MVRLVKQRFCCLRTPEKLRDSEIAEETDEIAFEPLVCSVDEMHMPWGRRLTDLSLVLRTSRPKDFLWTWTSDLLCTEDVLAALREAKITGFETRPAKVVSRARTKPTLPAYHEIVVTGWGGIAAPESGLELLRRCPGCQATEYRISDPTHLIDESAWDRSDWFRIWPMPKYHFISDRTAELLRTREFSGIDIVEADRVFSEPRKFGPGRLRSYMPEERARQIGEPLGIY